MADLYDYVTETGVIVPDTDDIKADVQTEFQNVFGNDISLEDSTPQGRLIDTITLSRQETIRTCALIANVINPDQAYGSFLDALCNLFGCVRIPAGNSTVTATLSGVAGTVIEAGSQAQTTNGDIFVLDEDVTIGSGGTAEGTFTAQESGPISCPINSLTIIKTGVLGWEGVNNDDVGTLGRPRENDIDLAIRRKKTLYSGRSLLGDLEAHLSNVPDVLSYYTDQNGTLETVTKDGIILLPRSVYACVFGGTNSDVAMALYQTCGCVQYNGSVEVDVTDPWNGKSYTVAFDRPTVVEVDVEVTIKSGTGSGDVEGAVTQAVIDFNSGIVPDVAVLGIGVEVSPFEIASAVNIEVPNVFVKKVQIAIHGGTLSTDSISIANDEIGYISEENITVVFE